MTDWNNFKEDTDYATRMLLSKIDKTNTTGRFYVWQSVTIRLRNQNNNIVDEKYITSIKDYYTEQ